MLAVFLASLSTINHLCYILLYTLLLSAILYPGSPLGCHSDYAISKILLCASFILNGTLVIHFIPVIAEMFSAVYKALSATCSLD